MILFAAISLIAISVIAIMIHWLLMLWKFRNIPHETPLPIIGSFSQFLTTNDFRREISKFVRRKCDNMEQLGLEVIFLGPKPTLFVTKPEFISEILRDKTMINKGDEYNYLDPWLGKGLITSNGQQWKQKRKLLAPSFHSEILNDFIPAINEQVDKFISILNECAEQYVDIRPMFTNLTLDIISATAMGFCLEAQKCENSNYIDTLNNVLLLIVRRVFSTLHKFEFIYPLTTDGQQFNEGCAKLREHSSSILRSRKLEIEEELEYSSTQKKKTSFMELLIKQQKMDPSITDEDIREDVDTIMFAGHDTTAICLKWTFLLLGNDERVQQKIRNELNSIFGDDSKREVNRDDLSKMNYIECVIKDSLRLYPPAPVVERTLPKEFKLDGYIVPKGLNVFLQIHASHRDARLWPNPNAFNPERFLEMPASTLQTAFLSFAPGPRNCIGQRFAMIELKLIIAQIFRHFTIEALNKVNEIESIFEVIYKPISEIKIKFEKLESK